MIFVVFNNRAEFDQFKAEFPRTLVDPDTLLGEPATENEDGTGMCFVCHGFTGDECAVLQLAGADVRVGAVDGPEWGTEPQV
jgi:hypothetical protein